MFVAAGVVGVEVGGGVLVGIGVLLGIGVLVAPGVVGVKLGGGIVLLGVNVFTGVFVAAGVIGVLVAVGTGGQPVSGKLSMSWMTPVSSPAVMQLLWLRSALVHCFPLPLGPSGIAAQPAGSPPRPTLHGQ